MSIALMSKVWELDLSAVDKLVLLALADWANDEGKCWPSIARIAAKSGCGERTVQRAISDAVKAGHLSREEKAGKGCLYTLHPRLTGTHASQAPVPKRRPTPASQAPNTPRTTKSPVSANADTPPSQIQPKDVLDAWNDMAAKNGLPIAKLLTEPRRKRLRTMIAQHPPDDFATALDAVERSPFCRGEKTDFKADFDFFLQTKSFTKLLEGAYG